MLEAVHGPVQAGIAQPVVGRHVHDPGVAVDQVGDQRRRLGVRVADGRQVPGVHGLDVGGLQPPLHTVLRRHLDQSPAGVAAGGDHPELERRWRSSRAAS